MNQQDQIRLLASALAEVGKMPEWMNIDYLQDIRDCYENDDPRHFENQWHLAALAGVAAEFIADFGLAIIRRKGCGECFDREERDDCEDCGGKVAHEIIRHNWMSGSDELGTHETRIEALAAAVRVAGKGEGQ